jgi:hypothetical protein
LERTERKEERKKDRKKERKCFANNTGNVICKQHKEIALFTTLEMLLLNYVKKLLAMKTGKLFGKNREKEPCQQNWKSHLERTNKTNSVA